MEIDIVKIGNSQGIRIPYAIINQLGIEESVDLEVRKSSIIIKPIAKRKPRQGWEEAFAKYASPKGENLIDGYTTTKFDTEDYEW